MAHEVGVKQAERGEISRGRIKDIIVDSSDVLSWLQRVSAKDHIRSLASNWLVGTEEIIREAAVLEEAAGDFHVQLAACVPPINEESDWKCSLKIRGEIAGRNEAEGWICCNGVLDALETELSGDGEIVFSGAEFVAKGNKLS